MNTALAAAQAGHEEAGATKAFGFWIYLMSDLVLFAALFATYAVLSRSYADGPAGRDLFHLPRVFVETMLLLTSSAGYGMVMLAVRAGRARVALFWLALTFLLGAGFILMEAAEFHAMILAGDGPDRSAFLSAFFTLVGTHGTHVSFGLVWMAVMMLQVASKGLTAAVRTRLLCLGMFWHFLDIVWIGVFSVVYLLGVTG
ncbi:MAG TPA: cytochrome o ubiquinol oxidase subunit III [Gallionellaceae bacterium]|nr:cytochrome o ubiquinol oxidase subunit III [Gallionellaceae bacterium]